MSIPFGKGDILFQQRLLACGGFYDAKLDGLWGDKSRKAVEKSVLSCAAIRIKFGMFDPRSETNIATLLPKMQDKARQILKVGADFERNTGVHVLILSGTRTYAEQNVLFNQRPKVTNARGGQSNHNFGIALDVGLFKAGKYLTGANRTEERLYVAFAAQVKQHVPNIDWGGDWKSFKDQPHYEYHTGLSIAQKRSMFEAGKLMLT